jgi:histone deacetylase 1/2
MFGSPFSSISHASASDSFPPSAMPTPAINHVINVKLKQGNYLLWSTQILPYLRSQGLIGHVDGSTPAPSQTISVEPSEKTGGRRIIVNPEYTAWYHQDQLVLSFINSSLTEEILANMVGVTTARNTWVILEKMFASSSRAKVMQIRMQLSTIQKKDLSITNYYNKVKHLSDTLTAVGKRLQDDELIAYLLRGLGPDYEPLVTSITTRVDTMSISDVYAHMLDFETRQEYYNSFSQVTSANNVNRSSGRGRGGRGRGGRGGGGGRSQGAQVTRPQKVQSAGASDKPLCQICHKPNHDALQCWHRFDNTYQAEDTVKQAAAATSDANWYVDTGATDHITHDLERLNFKERYGGGDQIHVANGAGLSISHVGHSSIAGFRRPLYLNHILYAPKIHKHLVSVRKLASDNDAFVEFHPNSFCVKDRATKNILLTGGCKNGLYVLPSNKHHALLTGKISQEHWHRRLGHPANPVTLRILQENNVAVDTRVLPCSICNACQQGKAHQLPFVSSSHVSTAPLQLIHTDVWGPALPSANNSKYYVSFIDDFSRYVWVYFLRNKSEVEPVFLQFQKHVERMLNTKILSVQSDWGGEYHRLHNYFAATGISHHISCPHTHQQNGLAERKHRHIVETGLTLLAQAQMPLRFWDEAFNTACYLINRMPSRTTDQDTPLHRLLKTHPDYSRMRVFGCACWPNLRAYNDRKLSFRTKQCVFLGYSSSHKGYKCLDRATGRIYISRDVVFDESVFPFSIPDHSESHTHKNSHHPAILPCLAKTTQYTETSLLMPDPDTHPTEPAIESDLLGNDQTNPVTDMSPVTSTVAPAGSSEVVSCKEAEQLTDNGDSGEQQVDTSGTSSSTVAQEEADCRQHPMQTRLRSNIVKPKQFTDGTVRYSETSRGFTVSVSDRNPTTALTADRDTDTEPTSTEEALGCSGWVEAMDSEYSALMKNNTWDLVPLKKGINLIGS